MWVDQFQSAEEDFLKQMLVGPCFVEKKTKINGRSAVTILTLRNNA